MEIKVEKKGPDLFNLYLDGDYIRTCIDREGVLDELTKRVKEL
ncbi:MAG TPA: hypothetical protein VMV95_02605 [Bacillota bacterium]|nr:hypothetical protein [Bacillota bacterium]